MVSRRFIQSSTVATLAGDLSRGISQKLCGSGNSSFRVSSETGLAYVMFKPEYGDIIIIRRNA